MLTSKNIIIAILVVLLLGLGGTATYFYIKNQEYQSKLNNPNQADREETERLIATMSKIIDLPEANLEEGEPTLATVLDKEKLKEQEFFKNAENDDKMLIYTKAQKAFLYRPSTNKIINVAPISIGQNLPTTVIRNGTTNSGLADNTKTKLATIANVTATENASRTNFNTTVVISLNQEKAEQAKAIADALGVTVSTQMPSGESQPANTDVVVIVGADQE